MQATHNRIPRTVVHVLACGPKTHSQIVKAVGERMLKHRHGYFPSVRIQSLLDQTLAQVHTRFPRPKSTTSVID